VHERLDAKRLKLLLRNYGVRSQQTTGGYYKLKWADLERMWASYVPEDAPAVNTSTGSTTSTQIPTESEQVNTATQNTVAAGFGGYGVPKPSDVARQVEKRKKATPAAPGERTAHDRGPTFKGEKLTSAQWAAREAASREAA